MQTTFSTQAQKHFCPADPYSTSIPAAAHFQLQRCKGHSLVSFSYLGLRLIFFFMLSFDCIQSFSWLYLPSLFCSQFAGITLNLLLFCWIYSWFFCSFIFCGNASRPALVGSLTRDHILRGWLTKGPQIESPLSSSCAYRVLDPLRHLPVHPITSSSLIPVFPSLLVCPTLAPAAAVSWASSVAHVEEASSLLSVAFPQHRVL